MPDDTTQTVPGQTAPSAPTAQTPPTGSPEATPKAPESLTPPPPQYMTRDETSALLREQLTQFTPEFVSQLKQQMANDFASKSEIQKNSQSAADKTFAKLMKNLAPEMRGIDKAVKFGAMDAEQAKQAKMQMLTDAAASMDTEEPEPPAQQQPPQPQPQNTINPVDILRQETSKAAQRILNKAGLTWDNVRAELAAYRASQGRDMPLEEFNEMVAGKMVEKGTQGKETEWMKNYEAKVTAAKAADKGGAMVPPPVGAPADYKPRPTLDDANDIGDVLIKHYPQLSQQ